MKLFKYIKAFIPQKCEALNKINMYFIVFKFFYIVLTMFYFVKPSSAIVKITTEPNLEYSHEEELSFFGRNETALLDIRMKMYYYALQPILTNFVEHLIILNDHVDIGYARGHLRALKERISELTFGFIKELDTFLEQLLNLLEGRPIIKSWDHLRTHIITDYNAYITKYLAKNYVEFEQILSNIKDRESFEHLLNIYLKVDSRKLDIITIFLYWYDALTNNRGKNVTPTGIKKAIFDRLVLEKPHWFIIFAGEDVK